MVTNYIEDRTAPVLLSFTLDMNTGYLSLFFSETVNLATLRPSHLTLQSVANLLYYLRELHPRTHHNASSGYATSLVLPIYILDLDQIKFRLFSSHYPRVHVLIYYRLDCCRHSKQTL